MQRTTSDSCEVCMVCEVRTLQHYEYHTLNEVYRAKFKVEGTNHGQKREKDYVLYYCMTVRSRASSRIQNKGSTRSYL